MMKFFKLFFKFFEGVGIVLIILFNFTFFTFVFLYTSFGKES